LSVQNKMPMKTEERIQKQREVIEILGRFFDKEGLQPISGRILGLLMVMDKEQFTFDEIVEELQISKSSASNALRNLEIRGQVEYITIPGDRKRYFQLKRHDVFSMIKDFEERLKQMNDLLRSIIELKADKNSPNCKVFDTIIAITDFVIENLEKYKQQYSGE